MDQPILNFLNLIGQIEVTHTVTGRYDSEADLLKYKDKFFDADIEAAKNTAITAVKLLDANRKKIILSELQDKQKKFSMAIAATDEPFKPVGDEWATVQLTKLIGILKSFDIVVKHSVQFPNLCNTQEIYFHSDLVRILSNRIRLIDELSAALGNNKTQKDTSKNPQKKIPDLPEIFKSRDYFDTVIARLKNDEFIELNRTTGRYKWAKKKSFLAGLALKLEKCNRLQNPDKYPNFKINTDKKQDLGRVFCKYFENIDFIEPIDKAFQKSSVTGSMRKPFNWITEI